MSATPKDNRVKGTLWDIPHWIIYTMILMTCLATVPPAIILWARAVPSDKPRIHIFQNMDHQPKYSAQQENLLFKDSRSMRPPVAGTVARGGMMDDTHFWLGQVDGQYATDFPTQVTVDDALLDRGQSRYDIYCLPCHGVTGMGDGPVHDRAMVLLNNGTNGTVWVQPRNLHQPDMADQSPGKLFQTISNGFGNMAGYASQIPPADRWAIVAWVYALQVGRNAPADAVPNSGSLPVVSHNLDGGGGS